jgi:regulator of ribonuclease activity A
MAFATADLIDAYEHLQSCDLQFSSFGKSPHFSGSIHTVRCRHDNALLKGVLSQPGSGRILVVDGDGSLHCALVGDLIAGMAVTNGWAGIVVYGAIRDSAAMALLNLGVKSLGTNPRRSAKSGQGEVGVPVEFGGVVFTPGHWLYSDEDGIVVSPSALGT